MSVLFVFQRKYLCLWILAFLASPGSFVRADECQAEWGKLTNHELWRFLETLKSAPESAKAGKLIGYIDERASILTVAQTKLLVDASREPKTKLHIIETFVNHHMDQMNFENAVKAAKWASQAGSNSEAGKRILASYFNENAYVLTLAQVNELAGAVNDAEIKKYMLKKFSAIHAIQIDP